MYIHHIHIYWLYTCMYIVAYVGLHTYVTYTHVYMYMLSPGAGPRRRTHRDVGCDLPNPPPSKQGARLPTLCEVVGCLLLRVLIVDLLLFVLC